MRISATWYGTVALHLVAEEELGVFLDPFFQRPDNAFPRIFANPDTVDVEPLDALFVSHGHFDHIFNLPNLIRRYPSSHAYVPSPTVESCRKLCNGAIFKDRIYALSEDDWERIHTVTAGDRIEVPSRKGTVKVQATAIQSKHVRFDAYSIFRALFNWRLWQRFGYYMKLASGFPAKEVIGWELTFTTASESKRILYFGSLPGEQLQTLDRYSDCDYLIVALAGRRNILPQASVLTTSLRPKAVLPVHYDNFFPPVSTVTKYKNYEDWLRDRFPNTKFIELQAEQPTFI